MTRKTASKSIGGRRGSGARRGTKASARQSPAKAQANGRTAMVTGIGRTTSPSTATHRSDISGNQPASFRYNNPGAQYPSAEAARFGQSGYGIIGGGHKIARFPSPVNGAASNFDLLYRNYTGMTIGAAGKKWTGTHGFGVPGYNPNSVLTKQMVDEPRKAIALLKAIAHRESGKGNNLTEDQWRQAHRMFKVGNADAYLDGLPTENLTNVKLGAKTGAGLLKLAREHIGEEYDHVVVPKDDASWVGPWDCAEFVSWVLYQEAGILYGCTDNKASPSKADAYTGAWKRDAESLGNKVSVEKAAATVGGILLRYPPVPGRMGHIALCDGKGGTVEAKGRRYGVVADTVQSRTWHTGILVPGIKYDTGSGIEIIPPETIYEVGAPNMIGAVVVRIQETLASKGFNPGEIDGDFGPNTRDAVLAFQEAEGLTVDGQVGPETAGALGVSLAEVSEQKGVVSEQVLDGNPLQLLILVLTLLSKEKSMAKELEKSEQGFDSAKLLLPLLLQSLLTGKQVDTTQLLTALLTGKPIIPTAQEPVSAPTEPSSQSYNDLNTLLLPLLYERLTGSPMLDNKPSTPNDATESTDEKKLTPVNAALGQTVGKLLDGKKTGFGILGLLATTLVPIFFPQVAPIVEVVKDVVGQTSGGTSEGVKQVVQNAPTDAQDIGKTILQAVKPIFGALAGWGILGKLEKWFNRSI